MDPSEALHLPGVKAFISADDVPGNNRTGFGNDEEVYATDKVHPLHVRGENNLISQRHLT